jgi:hypothetical protein
MAVESSFARQRLAEAQRLDLEVVLLYPEDSDVVPISNRVVESEINNEHTKLPLPPPPISTAVTSGRIVDLNDSKWNTETDIRDLIDSANAMILNLGAWREEQLVLEAKLITSVTEPAMDERQGELFVDESSIEESSRRALDDARTHCLVFGPISFASESIAHASPLAQCRLLCDRAMPVASLSATKDEGSVSQIIASMGADLGEIQGNLQECTIELDRLLLKLEHDDSD